MDNTVSVQECNAARYVQSNLLAAARPGPITLGQIVLLPAGICSIGLHRACRVCTEP